jgi:hypothetical protein
MGLTWAWIAGAVIGWFFVAPIISGPINGIVHTVFRGAAGYRRSSYYATDAPGTVNVLSPSPKYFSHPWMSEGQGPGDGRLASLGMRKRY